MVSLIFIILRVISLFGIAGAFVRHSSTSSTHLQQRTIGHDGYLRVSFCRPSTLTSYYPTTFLPSNRNQNTIRRPQYNNHLRLQEKASMEDSTSSCTQCSQPKNLTTIHTTTASPMNTSNRTEEELQSPLLLQPFLPALLDPNYSIHGPVGEGEFLLSREGGPTQEELSNENLYKILMLQCSDLEVNTLVWKALGYRFDPIQKIWDTTLVFPKWKEKFADHALPPDLIGMTRIYSKERDQLSLKANQQLVRSIPVDFKQSLKTHLKYLGFTGYKYSELTPNKTRRAQCANWLLYYREELFGYTVDELRERKRIKEEKKMVDQDTAKSFHEINTKSEKGANIVSEWKPPVTEVF